MRLWPPGLVHPVAPRYAPKAFATAGSKRKAAKADARMEARATGTKGAGAVDEASVQAKLAASETTSLFNLPREERWALIELPHVIWPRG